MKRIDGRVTVSQTCVRARGGLGPRSTRSGFPEARYIKDGASYATGQRNLDLGFCHLSACAASVAYSIPPTGVHRRTGEQVSGTTRPCDPVRERAN